MPHARVSSIVNHNISLVLWLLLALNIFLCHAWKAEWCLLRIFRDLKFNSRTQPCEEKPLPFVMVFGVYATWYLMTGGCNSLHRVDYHLSLSAIIWWKIGEAAYWFSTNNCIYRNIDAAYILELILIYSYFVWEFINRYGMSVFTILW